MTRPRPARAVALAAALGLVACGTTPPAPLPAPGAGPGTVFAQPSAARPAAPDSAPALYARDGTIVVDPQSANVVAGDRPTPARRALTPSDGGRMYLLELYQNVIEERDGLSREVTSLQADLEQARAELRAALEVQEDLRQRLGALEATNTELVAENLDLAGRLTTAQIRRLQAEKLLLEHRIAAERSAREAAGGSELAEARQP